MAPRRYIAGGEFRLCVAAVRGGWAGARSIYSCLGVRAVEPSARRKGRGGHGARAAEWARRGERGVYAMRLQGKPSFSCGARPCAQGLPRPRVCGLLPPSSPSPPHAAVPVGSKAPRQNQNGDGARSRFGGPELEQGAGRAGGTLGCGRSGPGQRARNRSEAVRGRGLARQNEDETGLGLGCG